MISSLLKISLLCCVLAAAGCSDDPQPGQDGQAPDSGLDGGADTVGGNPDMAPDTLAQVDQGTPDSVSAPSAKQTVINKLILPRTGANYAMDLDGNGTKENRLGAIMGVLNLVLTGTMNLQTNLDLMVNQGSFILLFDVLARSIVSDPSMKLQFYLGSDLDSNAADNFSGTEDFGISISSPKNLILPGKIAASKLQAGPGSLLVPVPVGISTTLLALKKARVEATIGTSGMSSGSLIGAVPMTDVDNKLLPAMASQLDAFYKSSSTPAAVKAVIGSTFDTNNDGSISGKDLKDSGLLRLLIFADVDTDGDKKMDAMSMGMGFTAVNCTIKKF